MMSSHKLIGQNHRVIKNDIGQCESIISTTKKYGKRKHKP